MSKKQLDEDDRVFWLGDYKHTATIDSPAQVIEIAHKLAREKTIKIIAMLLTTLISPAVFLAIAFLAATLLEPYANHPFVNAIDVTLIALFGATFIGTILLARSAAHDRSPLRTLAGSKQLHRFTFQPSARTDPPLPNTVVIPEILITPGHQLAVYLRTDRELVSEEGETLSLLRPGIGTKHRIFSAPRNQQLIIENIRAFPPCAAAPTPHLSPDHHNAEEPEETRQLTQAEIKELAEIANSPPPSARLEVFFAIVSPIAMVVSFILIARMLLQGNAPTTHNIILFVIGLIATAGCFRKADQARKRKRDAQLTLDQLRRDVDSAVVNIGAAHSDTGPSHGFVAEILTNSNMLWTVRGHPAISRRYQNLPHTFFNHHEPPTQQTPA